MGCRLDESTLIYVSKKAGMSQRRQTEVEGEVDQCVELVLIDGRSNQPIDCADSPVEVACEKDLGLRQRNYKSGMHALTSMSVTDRPDASRIKIGLEFDAFKLFRQTEAGLAKATIRHCC